MSERFAAGGTEAADHRLLPFGLLLDRAMAWTRGHLRSVVLPLGTPVAVLNGLLAATQAGTMTSLGGATEAASATAVAAGCLLPLLMLAVVAATGLVYAAVTAAAVDAVAGRGASAKRSLLFVLSPGPLGTLLLTAVFTGASYLCCIVPVLYVGPLLSLTVPAMVEEDLRGMDAVVRSAHLTRYNPRGRFLSNPLTKAFVLFAVAFLLSMLLSIATTLPFQVAQQWVLFRDAGTAGAPAASLAWVLWLQVPASLLGSYVSTAVWLYASFGLALLFVDTRRRKEGLDLEEAIAALERERSVSGAGPEGAPA